VIEVKQQMQKVAFRRSSSNTYSKAIANR